MMMWWISAMTLVSIVLGERERLASEVTKLSKQTDISAPGVAVRVEEGESDADKTDIQKQKENMHLSLKLSSLLECDEQLLKLSATEYSSFYVPARDLLGVIACYSHQQKYMVGDNPETKEMFPEKHITANDTALLDRIEWISVADWNKSAGAALDKVSKDNPIVAVVPMGTQRNQMGAGGSTGGKCTALSDTSNPHKWSLQSLFCKSSLWTLVHLWGKLQADFDLKGVLFEGVAEESGCPDSILRPDESEVPKDTHLLILTDLSYTGGEASRIQNHMKCILAFYEDGGYPDGLDADDSRAQVKGCNLIIGVGVPMPRVDVDTSPQKGCPAVYGRPMENLNMDGDQWVGAFAFQHKIPQPQCMGKGMVEVLRKVLPDHQPPYKCNRT